MTTFILWNSLLVIHIYLLSLYYKFAPYGLFSWFVKLRASDLQVAPDGKGEKITSYTEETWENSKFKKKKERGAEEFSLHGNNLCSKYNLGLSLCLLFLYSALYVENVVNDRVLVHCSTADISTRYLSHESWVVFCWGSKSSPLFFVGM